MMQKENDEQDPQMLHDGWRKVHAHARQGGVPFLMPFLLLLSMHAVSGTVADLWGFSPSWPSSHRRSFSQPGRMRNSMQVSSLSFCIRVRMTPSDSRITGRFSDFTPASGFASS